MSGTTPRFFSWPVAMLPFMERNDIYKSIAGGATPTTFVATFICPSTPPDSQASPWLAYAGNGGSGANTTKWDGVMQDTSITISGSTNGRVSMDDVSAGDGTAYTLILSEKCGAGLAATPWSQTTWNVTATTYAYANSSSSLPVFGITGSGTTATKIINSGTVGAPSYTPGFYSQPHSNHPGGAVAAFCDNHTVFLKDSLSAKTYANLLNWDNSRRSATPGGNWVNTTDILSDADYQ